MFHANMVQVCSPGLYSRIQSRISSFKLMMMIMLMMLVRSVSALPLLAVEGFGWAENLAFDGLGSLFVSEMTRGELHRIWLCDDGSSYCSEVHTTGFKNIGGLAVSPDGTEIYAAVTFADKTHGIISTKTSGKDGTYSIVAKDLSDKPNGMQLFNGVFFCTAEGGVAGNGTVFTVSLSTGEQKIVQKDLNADGAWIDPTTLRLFIGQVKSMKIAVFDISGGESPIRLDDIYPGPSKTFHFPGLQLLDDLTLAAKGGQSSSDFIFSPKMQLLGADWVGKRLLRFSLDGEIVETVQPPEGIKLKELTSVRWGKGPGFDSNSVYVTEGGGLTPRVTNRRVVQIPISF